ncbi:MAG TPA: oligosaccharide flippase family protein [Tepidisphaeraceae bacterium]|nr:oligosaccharide flippase family protein [Tepidisphaeraceae bacterium]
MVPTPSLETAAPPASTSTSRNILFVTAGRVGLLAAWFAATMLLARVLGPIAFGLYTLAQNAIRIVTNCVGDPLDMAVMRDAPLYLRDDRPRALDVIHSAFWLRVALGVLSIALAAAAPSLIARVVFDDPALTHLALWTATGILGDLLLRSALGYFQVAERFGPFMLVDVVWQVGRAAAAVVLVVMHLISTQTAIMLYVIAPYVAFLVALIMLPRDVRAIAARPPRGRMLDVVHYSKWMAAAMMLGAVYERLDLFLLSWFRGPRDVGIYAGAMALAVIPDFLNGAIQTVLAPKVAPAHARGEFAALQRRYFTYALPLGVIAIAAAWLMGGPIIRAFLSAKYGDSILAFKILIVGTIFNIAATPLSEALLNFTAPKKVMVLTAAGLAIVAGAGVVTIPRYGVTGAACVIVVARVIVGAAVILSPGGTPPESKDLAGNK